MWEIGESVEQKPGISNSVFKIISLLCNLDVTNVSIINGNNSGCQQFEQWVYGGIELWDVREFVGLQIMESQEYGSEVMDAGWQKK
jgi:hypothetical protein